MGYGGRTRAGWYRPIRAFVAILFTCTACGPQPGADSPAAEVPDPPSTVRSHSDQDVVDASAVIVFGDLSKEQLDMAEWALGRFELGGLQLPAEIEVAFDPSKAQCGGHTGRCSPPNGTARAVVCEPVFDTAASILDRRITLLHELAHLWHWSSGDGTTWPDHRQTVGGEFPDTDVAWEDRMNERVAVVIAWGLLDQLRRPVDLDIACAELYSQFVQLTGRPPLGPLDLVCQP
jgi:hypothetical protein